MRLFLLVLAAALTVAAAPVSAHSTIETSVLNPSALLPALGLVWGLTLLAFAPAQHRKAVTAPLKWLRGRAGVLWVLILVYLVAALGVLNLLYQSERYTRSGAANDLFVFLLAAWGLGFLIGAGMIRDERSSLVARLHASRRTGILITLTTLVVVFVVTDVGARLVLAHSDGFGFTFMATNWLSRYWQPVNALGYRDFEIRQNLPDGVDRIIVTGDSFAAGYGVAPLEEAFPHRLGALLGDAYAVNVVARPGWATDNALAALAAYPVQPDVLIVSHYIDDIRTTAQELGLPHPVTPYPPPPLSWLIGSFQIPNYVFWHIYAPRTFLAEYRGQFQDFVRASYDTPAIWSAYAAKLGQFVDIARANRARLVAVVWPDMLAIDRSADFTQPVAEFFSQNGALVLDMTDTLRQQDASVRFANAYDFHPSPLIHRLAAERLARLLAQP